MIKVSVLYPNQEGSTLDMACDCNRHISMVQKRFGAALKTVVVGARDRRRETGIAPAVSRCGPSVV
jgi:hypothetical protein